MTAYGFAWHQTTVAKTELAERAIRVNEAVALAELLDASLNALMAATPAAAPSEREQQAKRRLEELEEEASHLGRGRKRRSQLRPARLSVISRAFSGAGAGSSSSFAMHSKSSGQHVQRPPPVQRRRSPRSRSERRKARVASVKKRPDGRWRARYRDAAGKEHAKHFGRKIDGQRWLDDVTASQVAGTYVDPRRSRVTVGEWSQTWLAGRSHLKPKTVESYKSLLRTRVLPTWGGVPLVSVTHGDVVAWIAGMRTEGLSASRTRQAYHVLSAMLDDAVKDARLPRNPAASIALPRRLPTTERRYLTHAELAALADAAGEYRLLVLVLGYCGLRWGEAAALKVRRIDLLRGRLEIVEAVVDVNGTMVFGPPKSHQHRSVPVPRFLRDDLAGQLAAKGPDDLVFTSPRGEVLRVQNFRRRYFDTAAAQVGLDGLVPHELRHTAASLAISAGASVKGVQAMLGHASATLTLDRYGHLFGDELDAVAGRIDAARLRAADFLRTTDGPEVLSAVEELGAEAG